MADNSDDEVLLKLILDDEGFQQVLLKSKQDVENTFNKADITGFAKRFDSMKQTIGDIISGDASLSTMAKAFTDLGPLIVGTAVAVAGLALVFHEVMKGEQVDAVNKEFDILAKNAGVAGDALKEGFLKAAGGMLTDVEALELANRSMSRLGSAAEKMPELMELARKSALIMGRDVSDQFESLVRAVQTGNQRMLARVGIQIDAKKAEQDYAASLGISTNALSQQGKEQAIMNALLSKGAKNFDGVNESITPVTTAWRQLKVVTSEFFDTFAKDISGIFGPAIKYTLNAFTEVLHVVDALFKIKIPTSVSEAKKSFEDLKNALKGVKDEASKPISGSFSDAAKNDAIDKEKIKENHAKFLKDIHEMDAKAAKDEIALAQTDVQLKKGENDERIAMEVAYNSRIESIRKADYLSSAQKKQEESRAFNEYEKQKEVFEDQSLKRREAMLDNYQKHAKGTYEGISRSAEVTSKKAQLDLQNSAKLGQKAFDAMSGGVINAFQEMGKGAAGGSAQIEKAVLSSLSSIAANYGQAMILASLWPFDPAVFAAGVGLEVLAGALGEVGSSSSSSSGASLTSGAGASGSNLSSSSSSSVSSSSVSNISQSQQKAVTINVQGSVFDSPQTGMRMVDLIRQASDSTGYAYVQIGNKPYGT